MNRIYRVIWSEAQRAWVVASELTSARGKRSRSRTGVAGPALGRLLLGGVAALLASPSWSADLYWDVDGGGVNIGGTGIWNTTSEFWNTTGNAAAGPFDPWNNGALDNAIFSGIAGTVTLGEPITVHNLTFNTSGYSLTGNTLTLAGTTPTITVDATMTATISSILAGTAGVTKAGAGTLTLTGANTFTGGVNINAGTLSLAGTGTFAGNINLNSGSLIVANDAALGAASNGIFTTAGTQLTLNGALGSSRIVTLGAGGQTTVTGVAAASSTRYTGAGGITASGMSLTNNANDYTGQTTFLISPSASVAGGLTFSSVGNLNEASALGAPTDSLNGTIVVQRVIGSTGYLSYTGTGSDSNRNWTMSGAGGHLIFANRGTGTLTLRGGIAVSGPPGIVTVFSADFADLELLGQISGSVGAVSFAGSSSARTITLGDTNSLNAAASISAVTVKAGSLANGGANSSLGAGTSVTLLNGAVLSYTGGAASSDRTWALGNPLSRATGTISNDSTTGALTLSGAATLYVGSTLTLGGSYAGGTNTFSGLISGTGNLASNGSGIWELTGANTRTGGITVNGGTLRAGNASAFGTTTTIAVGGGTLDLNDFNLAATGLEGSGGTVDLGSGLLTINRASSTSTFAGSIIGSGGLTKFGAGTLELTGQSTYTGATTVGGGVLELDFAAVGGGPTSNLISNQSTLNMGGGTLNIVGAANETNTQAFNGLNITAGSNTLSAASATGGRLDLNLGAINRTGGQIDFILPTIGSIATTNPNGALGGWATVNGSDYAQVTDGFITRFSNYVTKDNAATWLNSEILTDEATPANSPFTGTVSGSKQIGGLKYTAAATSEINISDGERLGVDGVIIVASSVGNSAMSISGGSLTGTVGGGMLGVMQNGGTNSNYTINSTIVDNGGAIGFAKSGTGLVTLTGNNTYTGATTVSGGTLSVNTISNGGTASAIGASGNASSNLLLEGATLRYTGVTTSSDRGFTLATNGAVTEGMIDVTQQLTNLEFSGVVTSPNGAGLTKIGDGTLTLSNANNNYTGVTTVKDGTLAVSTLLDGGSNSSIGASSSASSNLVLEGGGELEYIAGTTSSNRGFTLGTGGGAIDVAQNTTTLTLGGVAVGTGSLTKNGTGTLVLSGINAYTGGTTVSAGTLRAGSTQAFGTGTGLMTVNTGATLDLAGHANTVRGLSGGGNVLLGGAALAISGSATFSGTISGADAGSSVNISAVSQTFSGCHNTYEGPTRIGIIATLNVGCLADGGAPSDIGASTNASSNLVFTNGTLNYTGDTVTTDRGFSMTGGSSANIGVQRAETTLTFSGQVTGAGSVGKDGAGTLVLSGNNTYSGGTNVVTGTLRAGSTSAFGTGSMTVNAGASLDLANLSNTVAGLAGGGNVTLGSATLTLSDGAGLTFSGAIAGSGDLVKSGAGTQLVSGCNNSYGGTTTLNGGILSVDCLVNAGNNSAIGLSNAAASNLVLNGGTLRYTGGATSTDRLFTLGSSSASKIEASGTGALTFANSGAIAFASANSHQTITLGGTNTGNNSLAALITDNGTGTTSFSKVDGGTWILTNPNSTYTGVTTISGGVLGVDKLSDGTLASSIGASTSAASNLVIGTGGTLRYTGSGDRTDRLFTLDVGTTAIESSGTGAIEFYNTGTVTMPTPDSRTLALGGTNTGLNIMGGTLADPSGGVTTLAKNGPGTWVLTGNNTFTGNTVINGGNLIIGNGGNTGNAGAGNVIVASASSTLSINRNDAFDFSGTLSGPGSLAQIGTGTTRLTSTSNSIGATSVNAGTLEIDGSLTTATVAMNGAGTLNVDGTVQGTGGTAATFSGNNGASTVNVNAAGTLLASGDLGDGSDTLNVTGTLNMAGGSFGLGAGDDTFTLNDGATITGTVDAGTAVSGDTLRVNNAIARTFDGTGFTGFEQLTKQNTGVLTLTGTQTFSLGTNVTAGTLDVDGTLNTGAVMLSDNTTLNVDGALNATGALTGSAGVNTVLVNAGATLRANGDLGGGSDVVTVAGTLDTASGALNLGGGDDTFTLNDGAVLGGVGIDAGAATTNDVLVLNNAAALMLDGSMTAGFERLIKQSGGTATMTGNQTFSAGTQIDAGTLYVDGALQTPTVTLADGTTLNVDGTVQAAGGTQAAITGSAGANTILVNSGATLLATGDLGGGNDAVTIAGTVNTGGGSLSLGAGDDTVTLNDGAVIGGVGIDGGAATTSDVLMLNNAAALAFNGSTTTGFEALIKQNTGIATMTGTQTFSASTTISGGTLDVDGTLDTAAVALAGGTTLNVDGTVQAAGATQTTITGDASVNTIAVNGSATLRATGDLGDGDDVLDVAGTLDIGGSTLSLGDGDDSFVVHDGTNVIGTIDGGAGLDTRVYDINLNANIGALTGFEGLTKSGTGTLNINGPGTSTLAEVEVQGGTLNVASGAAIDGAVTTAVTSGATLIVDGSYAGSAANDTFTAAGNVNGAGTVNLGGGDDVLTLQDGASLNIAIDAGADTSGDRVVLDNASALTFDGTNVTGFETLDKQNAGTATLAGTHSYDSAAINGGVLDVNGTFNAGAVTLADGTTLNIDGTVQGAGGTQAVITGSTGVNTVTVTNGATLRASGDLGDGNDVLDVAGTLNTGGGTFSLGAGDDTFVVHDTTQVMGTLDAGAGNDQLNVNVSSSNLVPLGSTTGFESLGKSGLGTLEINGASDFVDVQVQAGLLDIDAAGSIEAQTASLNAGATLNVDGSFDFTTGADAFTVAGAVTGGGTINMRDGDDQLTILDGANLGGLTTSLDGGAGSDTLTANIATNATLGGVVGFETLTKQGVGTLDIAGPASSSFGTVDVQGGTLDVASGTSVSMVTATSVASGATLIVDGNYAGSAGNDTFTVAGTVSGSGDIGLGAGDDVLTIRDGTVLNIAIDAGADTAGDRVVLDNAAAFIVDSSDLTGFELLVKQNTGAATLTGTQTYDSTTISGGTLDVNGTLATDTASLADGTTLNVDGTMQGASGAHAMITGSTGVNTVTVAASATLAATGDLGDGSDVLDVAGTLDAGGGNFNLGAGDDTFVIHDGTTVLGTVVGGAGLDTRIYDIAGVANVDALQEFEGLTKRNSGTLNINGPATTDLLEVAIEGGTLNIASTASVTGVQTTTVDAGATMNVDGTYAGSAGDDGFTIAGSVTGAGSIDLGDGDDVLTLQDGAVLNAAVNGGTATGGDRVVLDNASAFTFDGTNVAGFEQLVKQNTGTATLIGTHTYNSTAIDAGTLDVDGTLETATVTLADDATLNIDGTVQAAGATQTVITGTTGASTLLVNASSTLLATGDLGDGNDVLDVAGTFATGGSTFYLGAGDDTFIVHDGTTITGTIDGGDGLDTRVYDINTSATLGALINFEGLTKTGTGVLTIQGPGSSALAEVEVLGGTLDIESSGGITGITSATLGAGAILNVDGVFDFTAGGDTFDIAGTISGATSINMLDGDDQLTLTDGADLSGLASSLDGGTGTDTLIANIATSATLGGVTSFENLTKQGGGTLNVASSSTFDTVLVEEGVLDVASGTTIEASTATVSEGATLNLAGDFLFTGGGDSFTVAGTVAGLGAIDMLDGNDQLTLRDGADLSGLTTALDGGSGIDTLTADIGTQATLGGAIGFETLIKQGAGVATITGPADSMFDTVHVREGELAIAAGALVDPQTTTVDAGATMTVDGVYHGTADADTFTLSGTLAGSGIVDLLAGDDVLTVNTGADVTFAGVFDANAASNDLLVLAGTGEDTFDASLIGTVFQNFDQFRKEGTGTWRLSGTGSNGWSVAEGTLIGDTESFGGNIDNAATVVFDQASDGTYEHVLSGNGTLIKQNNGTLVLSGTNTFSGTTQIAAGTLEVNGTLPSAITIASGATLSGIGAVGSANALAGSFVAPGAAGLPFGTLTITGHYSGGGTVRINTVLGNETSDTGRLVIQGNVTGTSTVLVNRWSGNGARTQGDGIEIIQVDGASAPDSFRLGQSVQAGAYEYLLYQGGSSDANDWYLRSELIDPNNPPDDGEEPTTPAFRAGVPGYVLGHQANLEYGFTALGNLRARVGDQGRVLEGERREQTADAWMRVYADELDMSGTRFEAHDLQMTTVQFGTDIYTHASDNASTHIGLMASVGESRATLFDTARAIAGLSTRAGETETDAKGIGMYWTHFAASGAYLDLSAQALHYSNRYRDQTLTDADQSGWGATISAELGAMYELGADWMIEPQLQLAYQRLELDAFDDHVSRIDAVDDDATRARAGLQLLRAPRDWLGMSNASPYIGVGAQHDFRGASAVTIGGTTLNDEIPDTTADISLGFTGSVRSGVELHLDMRYQKATEGERDGLRANFGFRMTF